MGLTSSRCLNIAHRGARSLAPENTLAAARKALELGADGWELDVALSADGELVVLHDDTLERTSDAALVFPDRAPWRVETFTLAELRRLDFGSWFERRDPFGQIAAGAIEWRACEAFHGERIPTLHQALEFTRQHNWWVNVEIKDASGTPGDAMIVAATVALIGALGMREQVLISSFNHAYLRQVKALQPALLIGALVESPVDDPPGLLRALGAQAYHPDKDLIQPEQARALRQQGFEVNIWTVNEDSEMHAWLEAGVSGIITDFPQRLRGMNH